MTNPQLHASDLIPTPGPALVQSASTPFTATQAHALLMEEIRVLRERGLSDECIHGLFSGFNIDAHPAPSGQQWHIPMDDQLIRLIWGEPLPTGRHLD